MEYLKLEKIFKSLNVAQPFDVARQIIGRDCETYYNYLHALHLSDCNAQHGEHIKKFTYAGIEITFYFYKDDDRIIFNIHRENDENKYACLVIFIFPETKIACIQSISYHPTCFAGMERRGGGSFLLKAALYFLRENKDKLQINKIQLTDNSFKYCKKSKSQINLALLSTLTTGETWYSKYGFIPYNPSNNITDEQLLKLQTINRKIMSTILVKQTRIEYYIRKSAKQHDIELHGIDKLFEHYNNVQLCVFLRRFLEDFDTSCVIFESFYLKFSMEIGIFDMHGKTLYLPL